MRVFCDFVFQSAHWLPGVPEGHKCRNLHGHEYRLKVSIDGLIDAKTGFVIDYTDVRHIVDEHVISVVDHKCLNEIEGLENPSAENISIWIWDRLQPVFKGLVELELRENYRSGVIYTGGQP